MMRRFLTTASIGTNGVRRTAIQKLAQVNVTCGILPVAHKTLSLVHIPKTFIQHFAALKRACVNSRTSTNENFKLSMAKLREQATLMPMPRSEVPAEARDHLHQMSFICNLYKSGEEISKRLSNELLFKGETDPVNCLEKIKDFFRILGLGPITADEEILNDYAERILEQSTPEDRLQTLIEYYQKAGVDVRPETFMTDLFLYNAATAANMCCMTDKVTLGVTAHGHYGQRVDDPKRDKTEPKFFYSPILLLNEQTPTDFKELIKLYRKTNTGNIIPKLEEDKKIDLYWIKEDALTVQQEVLVKEHGKTGYTELISSNESKQLLETYDASEEIAVLLGKDLVAIMPYENVRELKKKCSGLTGTEEEKIEQGFQIAREYVSEVTAKGSLGIRVYHDTEWVLDRDELQEVLLQQDKQQETELRHD